MSDDDDDEEEEEGSGGGTFGELYARWTSAGEVHVGLDLWER